MKARCAAYQQELDLRPNRPPQVAPLAADPVHALGSAGRGQGREGARQLPGSLRLGAKSRRVDLQQMPFGLQLAALAAFAAFALPACASSAPIQQRTEVSVAAIRAAEEVGAAKVPRAALYLQLAKEEAIAAKALAAAGDEDKAASLMLRAEADANLAVVVARIDTARAKAEASAERVRQLKQSNP